jgi:hypothetical protein
MAQLTAAGVFSPGSPCLLNFPNDRLNLLPDLSRALILVLVAGDHLRVEKAGDETVDVHVKSLPSKLFPDMLPAIPAVVPQHLVKAGKQVTNP